MSRRAERSKRCPTPSKGAHLTAEDAAEVGASVERYLEAAHIPFEPFYLYQCPCLRWHLTRLAYDRAGVPHIKASA